MSGIRHVTAISGKATRNLEFYQRVLGLRFVKKTVNFDDPSSYHFYYGDEVGGPRVVGGQADHKANGIVEVTHDDVTRPSESEHQAVAAAPI